MKVWIFPILVLIVMALMIIFPQNPAHSLFLQYISTLSTWPFVILIIGLILLFKYKKSISDFIRKPPRIQTRKGDIIEWSSQGEAKPIEDIKIKEAETLLVKESQVKEGLLIAVNFERNIRYMYRSQFNLLKYLLMNKKMNINTPKSILASMFYQNDYLKSGGHPNYSVDLYLGWLDKFIGFITEEKVDNMIMIKLTEMGESFISYCNFMNYSEKDFIPI